jgi:hypothetical protein
MKVNSSSKRSSTIMNNNEYDKFKDTIEKVKKIEKMSISPRQSLSKFKEYLKIKKRSSENIANIHPTKRNPIYISKKSDCLIDIFDKRKGI